MIKEKDMEKETKFRLIKHIEFLENEMKDYDIFKTLSWKEYSDERSRRRDVERWIENIINSTIDIAKIILMSENKTIPDSYKETIKALSILPDFQEGNTQEISKLAKLRNVITHEYLDIRWDSVRRFILKTKVLFDTFLKEIKAYIEKRSNNTNGKKTKK